MKPTRKKIESKRKLVERERERERERKIGIN
jgi:hypothetical protein